MFLAILLVFPVSDIEKRPQLTASKMLELSTKFTSASDLRKVAITGLGLPDDMVDKHINDNPKSTTAAYKLFKSWWKGQQDSAVALIEMNKALDAAKMPLWKTVLM